ncbi:MAG TPA: stage II sporulation protein M [Saprospiraceae bacterium]|nr:stage II sporulation protein M [Saprospiraceae bacterium]
MRETNFIRQNREKWKQFEQILDGQNKDAEKLNELFVQVTDDLSFSRTFYPNRSVRVYLNGLAQRAFSLIYKNRRTHRNRFLHFWTEELPQLMWEARRELALSFGIFALSMLIGALSSAMDSEFVNVILSEEYVEMTKRNIESGDPMAVYKGRGQLSMSMGITVNNLMVAFLTFATGAFFTLGSIVVLIRNGIMVGAFQYFFIERGLFWESFLTIWIHGTLEISAIIIAGAAGITVGKGLVFPGAYRRMQAFQRSARRGLKIMVGIAPIIILAGFIEGFLTRFTETPDVVRGAFIAACFAFVIFYFVWYPWSKAVKGFTSPVRDAQIPPDSNLLIDMNVIKSNGDIFSETFTLAKKNAGRLFIGSLVVALAYAAVAFPLAGKAPAAVFQFPQGFMAMLYKVSGFFRQADLLFLPLVGIAAMLAWSLIAFRWVDKETGLARKLRFTDILMPLPGVLLVWLLFFSNDWYTWLLLLFAAQMALLWAYTAYRERMDPIRAIGRMFEVMGGQYGRTLGLSLMMLLVSVLFFAVTDSALLWMYLDVLTWVVNLPEASMQQFSAVLLTVLHVFIIGFLFVLYASGCALLYHSLLEMHEAPALLRRIQNIGITSNIRGLEKE